MFWIALAVKMAVTAGFVVTATLVAERAGPVIGGLIATLPISAGPAYVFLALDHDAAFLARSALTGFIATGPIAIYGIAYAVLARRFNLAISLFGAFALWIASVILCEWLATTLTRAVLLNVLCFALCFYVARSLRHGSIPRAATYWYDLVLRAALVTVLVASVVTLSFTLGSTVTGVLAVFPIVFTSVILILHSRIGGPAASIVLANTTVGLIGFGAALLVLHLTVERIGAALALPLALAVSVSWGALVIVVRRWHLARAA